MILDTKSMGPKVCESKAAPFGLIHSVHFPVGTFGPPPLPADLACFALWEFFTDLDFILFYLSKQKCDRRSAIAGSFTKLQLALRISS